MWPDFFLVGLWGKADAALYVHRTARGEHVSAFQRRMEVSCGLTKRDTVIQSRAYPTPAMLAESTQCRALQVIKLTPVLLGDIVAGDRAAFTMYRAPFVEDKGDGRAFIDGTPVDSDTWADLTVRAAAERHAKSPMVDLDALPSGTVGYHRAVNISVFKGEMLWVKDKALKGHCTNLWKTVRYFITTESLPTRMRRVEVELIMETVQQPIEIATGDLWAQADGVRDATGLIVRLSGSGLVDPGAGGPLTQKLTGIVTAWVNGGPMMYCRAFFANGADYSPVLLAALDDALIRLIRETGIGLKVHGTRIAGLDGLQATMEINFCRLAGEISATRRAYIEAGGAAGAAMGVNSQTLAEVINTALVAFPGCAALFRHDAATGEVVEVPAEA